MRLKPTVRAGMTDLTRLLIAAGRCEQHAAAELLPLV
jgi:hypothetical protein